MVFVPERSYGKNENRIKITENWFFHANYFRKFVLMGEEEKVLNYQFVIRI